MTIIEKTVYVHNESGLVFDSFEKCEKCENFDNIYPHTTPSDKILMVYAITDFLNCYGVNVIERNCHSSMCSTCTYATLNGCIVPTMENLVDKLCDEIGFDPIEHNE